MLPNDRKLLRFIENTQHPAALITILTSINQLFLQEKRTSESEPKSGSAPAYSRTDWKTAQQQKGEQP